MKRGGHLSPMRALLDKSMKQKFTEECIKTNLRISTIFLFKIGLLDVWLEEVFADLISKIN